MVLDNRHDALSAKYVKIHGMSSAKWATKDKITQYKGLVNLFKRDREIVKVDANVAGKKQYKRLVNLRKVIETDRNELDNAIAGDRQHLRNTLAEHRAMQLAYQNTQPKRVIESLHQNNFTKRKELDKLKYQMKLKSQRLTDLKLEAAVLEDQLKYEVFGQIKEQKIAQIITGKVQDAILKKEAALAIQHTYAQIINIMKRDALYFDCVLSTIRNDGTNQAKCILSATKQGQLATEYKDDRQQEFETLEKLVVSDMKVQKQDLEEIREQAENAASGLKQLLRRDSDLTTCMMKVEESQDTMRLHADVEKIESTLSFLKNATLVSSFEAIYPCLQEQQKQKDRLTKLAKKCERNRDIIMNKMNHAELMSNMLKNTMVETTGQYKARKKELLEAIKAETEKKRHIDNLIKFKLELTAKVRMSLRQLQQLLAPVKREETKHRTTILAALPPVDDKPVEPTEDEIDGCKIITALTSKLVLLVSNAQEKLDGTKTDDAFRYYEALMKETSIPLEEEQVLEGSLLEGIVTEISHLLTREELKRQSDAIVAANTKDDDLIPVMPAKKKKWKFK